jgi:hypothetical protein
VKRKNDFSEDSSSNDADHLFREAASKTTEQVPLIKNSKRCSLHFPKNLEFAQHLPINKSIFIETKGRYSSIT